MLSADTNYKEVPEMKGKRFISLLLTLSLLAGNMFCFAFSCVAPMP